MIFHFSVYTTDAIITIRSQKSRHISMHYYPIICVFLSRLFRFPWKKYSVQLLTWWRLWYQWSTLKRQEVRTKKIINILLQCSISYKSLNRSMQRLDGSMTVDCMIADRSMTDDKWPIWSQFCYVKWRKICFK